MRTRKLSGPAGVESRKSKRKLVLINVEQKSGRKCLSLKARDPRIRARRRLLLSAITYSIHDTGKSICSVVDMKLESFCRW